MQKNHLYINITETHDVYKFLKTNSDGEQVDWNFAKYLIGRDGVTVRFDFCYDDDSDCYCISLVVFDQY